jgi:hypothetical protein
MLGLGAGVAVVVAGRRSGDEIEIEGDGGREAEVARERGRPLPPRQGAFTNENEGELEVLDVEVWGEGAWRGHFLGLWLGVTGGTVSVFSTVPPLKPTRPREALGCVSAPVSACSWASELLCVEVAFVAYVRLFEGGRELPRRGEGIPGAAWCLWGLVDGVVSQARVVGKQVTRMKW